ncbi:MAG: hypothetical protein NTY93_01345 [Candidatus Kaiserbacteria bacterium]|nr:hypothetical protein [Candidatus Kaiserbacteria bacterium]
MTGAEILHAAAPDPGHNFTEVGGGAVLGDILYGSGTDALSALAGNITTTKKFLRETGNGSAATAPAWDTLATGDIPDISATYSAKAGNTSLVTVGTLTTGALGSGFTAVADAQISSAATWNAKMTNPMTTLGDVIYGGASGVATRLAGAVGFFKSTGASAPTWSTINLAASADVGTSIVAVANGGTNLAAAVSDAVLVGDSTSAYTARTLPASCAGTTAKLLYDSTTNLFSCGTDQTGAAGTATQYNQSVAVQTPAVTDTYLVGSSIAIPASSLKIGTRYHMIFDVSKTAAGTATPILNIRFGTLGTTGDATKCTLTWTAQTAATDTGTFEIWTTFRTVGSGTTAVLQCSGQRRHGASVTGLGTLVGETKIVTSAGFDSTVANSIIGASITTGTSAVWTIQQVQAELSNLQ